MNIRKTIRYNFWSWTATTYEVPVVTMSCHCSTRNWVFLCLLLSFHFSGN